MRNKKEIGLAILSFKKDKLNSPQFDYFGDDNHAKIDNYIDLLNSTITFDSFEEMYDNDEIDHETYFSLEELNSWLNGGDFDLVDFLFDENNLVTEFETNDNNHCAKLCKECPFSNKSMKGWLADYTTDDIKTFFDNEISFPCHLLIKNDLSVDEAETSIVKGEMKLCRGYVEMYIKSCKSPKLNQTLIDAVNSIRDNNDLSDDSMSIHQFINHHKLD